MSDRLRKFALLLDAIADDLVERPGPGQAPTAFRMWAAGENGSDSGSIFFTEASAKKLIEEQAARGRLLSIDFDHLSLATDRPAEAGRAAGWHRLEVRTNDAGASELWATDIEWCADAKAGLEETPPRWRYFSPAFRVNKADEVTGYVNFALCINPQTHQLPSLATAGGNSIERTGNMDPKKMMAALAAYAEGLDGDEKEKFSKVMAEFGKDEPDGDEKKDAEGDDAEKEAPPPPKKDEEKKDAEGDEKKDEESVEKKAATSAGVDLARTVDAQAKKIEALEIKDLLAMRPDIHDSVKKWALTQSLKTVQTFLGATPKKLATLGDSPTTGKPEAGVKRLDAKQHDDLGRMMGIKSHGVKMPEVREDGTFVVHHVSPTELRTALAKGKA